MFRKFRTPLQIFLFILKIAFLGFLIYSLYPKYNMMTDNSTYTKKEVKIKKVDYEKEKQPKVGYVYTIIVTFDDGNVIKSHNQNILTVNAFKKSINKNIELHFYDNKPEYVELKNFKERGTHISDYYIDNYDTNVYKMNQIVNVLLLLILILITLAIL